MPAQFIKSHWLLENEIVYIEAIGDVDENIVAKVVNHWFKNYLDNATNPIDTILDMAGLTRQYSLHPIKLPFVQHKNIARLILVGSTDVYLVNCMALQCNKVFDKKFKHVTSLQEAKSYSIGAY